MADTKGLRINEQIRVREVRLIDEEGGKNGIVSTREALELAKERDLDLVEVSPNANPPVCKILNYGKYRFEQEKRLRDSRKAQKALKLKEMLSELINIGNIGEGTLFNARLERVVNEHGIVSSEIRDYLAKEQKDEVLT